MIKRRQRCARSLQQHIAELLPVSTADNLRQCEARRILQHGVLRRQMDGHAVRLISLPEHAPIERVRLAGGQRGGACTQNIAGFQADNGDRRLFRKIIFVAVHLPQQRKPAVLRRRLREPLSRQPPGGKLVHCRAVIHERPFQPAADRRSGRAKKGCSDRAYHRRYRSRPQKRPAPQ